jgi:hypothetical protein
MISVIGIGETADSILSFLDKNDYDCFSITDGKTKNQKCFKVDKKKTHEEYESETNCSFVESINPLNERLIVFVSGKDKCSSLTLKILDYFKNKKIEIFYIKPITSFLSQEDLKFEKVIRFVLQEYARSGLFEKVCLIDLEILKQFSQNKTFDKFYDTMYQTIAQIFHFCEKTEATMPIFDNEVEKPSWYRINTIGFCDFDDEKENNFYKLKTNNFCSYSFILNEERYRTDNELTKKVFNLFQEKQQQEKDCALSFKIMLTDQKKNSILIQKWTGDTQN